MVTTAMAVLLVVTPGRYGPGVGPVVAPAVAGALSPARALRPDAAGHRQGAPAWCGVRACEVDSPDESLGAVYAHPAPRSRNPQRPIAHAPSTAARGRRRHGPPPTQAVGMRRLHSLPGPARRSSPCSPCSRARRLPLGGLARARLRGRSGRAPSPRPAGCGRSTRARRSWRPSTRPTARTARATAASTCSGTIGQPVLAVRRGTGRRSPARWPGAASSWSTTARLRTHLPAGAGSACGVGDRRRAGDRLGTLGSRRQPLPARLPACTSGPARRHLPRSAGLPAHRPDPAAAPVRRPTAVPAGRRWPTANRSARGPGRPRPRCARRAGGPAGRRCAAARR